MESEAAVTPPKPKQPLVARIGYFIIGGLGTSGINWAILHAATEFLGWKQDYAYAVSTITTALIGFIWSYMVNFRTSRVWKNCLGRYVICQLLAISMTIMIGRLGLKHYGSTGFTKYLVIVVVQSFTGGIKFLLYHFWVFPHADAAPGKEQEVAQS